MIEKCKKTDRALKQMESDTKEKDALESKEAGKKIKPKQRMLGFVLGAVALFWFLVRVLPKPSRAAYPCQKMAAPIASWFVLSVLGLVGVVLSAKNARRCFFPLSLVYLCFGGFSLCLTVQSASSLSHATPPQEARNKPVGTAQGIHPGRVTWTHDPAATSWDGNRGYWWEDKHNNQTIIDKMLSKNLRWLAGSQTDGQAWQAFFKYFNQKRGKGSVGYKPGEKIVIKINMNNMWNQPHNTKQNNIDASPHLLLALLKQLVHQAKIPPELITVYDAIRSLNDVIYDPSHKAFPKVRFVGSLGTDGRIATTWIRNAVHYADGKTSSLPKSVIEADYQINMAILKRHAAIAPVTLCGKNYFGSIHNPADLHRKTQSWNFSMNTYTPIVDLMGHKHLGGKTMLFLIDGLYGAKSYSGIPKKWGMAPFNGHWPSSIFASQDIVAIDSVGFDFIWEETVVRTKSPNMTNGDRYLHEAAQAQNPPSKTSYDPEKDGSKLRSLGVHEHWNNATKKQYSRNLKTGKGIELIAAPPTDLPPQREPTQTEPTQADAGSSPEPQSQPDRVSSFDAKRQAPDRNQKPDTSVQPEFSFICESPPKQQKPDQSHKPDAGTHPDSGASVPKTQGCSSLESGAKSTFSLWLFLLCAFAFLLIFRKGTKSIC